MTHKLIKITMNESEWLTLKKVLDGLNDVMIEEQLQIDAGCFDLMYQAAIHDVEVEECAE